MKGVPPAPPPIKHRLSKPKTNDCTSSRNTTAAAASKGGSVPSSPVQTSPQQHQPRSSYGDLRVLSDARESLRRRVSRASEDTKRKASLDTVRKASFETVRRVSLDSVRSVDIMGSGRDRKIGEARSPSIADSESAMSRRMSSMQENSTIDVEAAITLLQELKKSASPEELVALHRALLPTKEVEMVTSPLIAEEDDYRSSFTSSSSTRRASRLPPGLATRGGTDEDVLRKPGQERSRSRPRKQALEHAQTVLHRKLSNTTEGMTASELASQIVLAADNRSHTPDEYSPSIGAYRAGTLRITNGTSSPEPNHYQDQQSRDNYFTSSHGQASETPYSAQPGRAHPDALPVLHRVLHSARNRQQQQHTPPPEQNTVDDAPVRKSEDGQDHPSRRQSLQVNTSDLPQSSPGVKPSSTSASTDAKRYYDDMRRSSGTTPIDTHADTSPKGSPSVGRNALLNFASRLSTVYGDDQSGEEDDGGTPDDALSKLMGQAPKGPRPAKSMKSMKERPVRLQHKDSGYGSDASQQTAAANQGSVKNARLSLNLPTSAEATASPQTDVNVEHDTDAQSVYNLNEFLSSPTLPSAFSDDAASPLSPKKSQRFLPFRSKSSKRNSVPVIGSASAFQSTDTIPSIASTSSSPASSEARQPKKLQKPMKRKQSLRKAAVKEAAALEISPPIPLTVAQAWEQRLESEASSASLDRTYDTAPSAKSQEELARGGTSENVHFPDSDKEDQGRRSSDRKRSFSRGRKGSLRRQGSEDESSDLKKSKSIFRKRSKSRSQSRRRASLDSVPEIEPVCTDFGSDGLSLGTGPYDLSTSQFKRNPNLARSAKIPQSPWQVGLVKNSKLGMSEQEAAELARAKSRDVAGRDMMNDRPHMAMPKRDRSQSNAAAATRSVEDYYPDWQSKGKQTAPPAQKAPVPPRAYSMYAESIPPMPDLPADVARKAAMAEEKVLKKMLKGDSPMSSKRTSAEGMPQSAEPVSKPVKAKRGGEATKASEQNLAQEQEDNKKSLELLHPAVRPKSTDEDVKVEVRETNGTSSEQSSMLEPESRPVTSDENDEYTGQPVSPSHDAQHSGWPGWEAQSQRWRAIRQRGMSSGATLPNENAIAESTDEESGTMAPRPPMHAKSPSIVVSRYITPLAVEHLKRANTTPDFTNDASRHADLYRDLIDDKENRPAQEDVDPVGSAISRGTFVTVQTHQTYDEPQGYDLRPAKRDIPRSDSAFSGRTMQSMTTTTTTSTRSRGPSPGGRVRTASGKYLPYNPARAAEAERSRAFSLARLMGDNHNGASTDSLPVSLAPSDVSERSKRRNDKVVDRYSGGLQYEWTRENGFGGSAGTRHSGEEGTLRKGQAMAEQFGVDLGDVPIMLQRSRGY